LWNDAEDEEGRRQVLALDVAQKWVDRALRAKGVI